MRVSLSPAFERRIAAYAREVKPRDVLTLSDFFLEHPGQHTPWNAAGTRSAYAAYYLPLNYARLRAVFAEVARTLPADAVSEVWDYGSGPGTTQWALEDSAWLPARPLHCFERAREAIALHEELLGAAETRFKPSFARGGRPRPGALATFSYSFLEMVGDLPDLEAFDHLLIVEPSTRACGRQLMEWRGRLLGRGFHVLAPCTHALACPLLVGSARDWCHMRVGFDGPAWWDDLERELPMKNRTLTYSYLLMSRTARVSREGVARVIGDTLREKGRARQMICRRDVREFVSWQKRDGEPPVIPHGALLSGVETCEVKGGELRAGPGSRLEWSDAEEPPPET